MNYFIYPFFLYVFFFLPRYLVHSGYIRTSPKLDLHTKQKIELIYLIVVVACLFALVEFEKSIIASSVVQYTASSIVKAFQDIFHYSDIIRPLLCVVMPYLFPVLYSYALSVGIFALMIVPSSSALFTILPVILFGLAQVFLFGLVNKRFDADFRVRLVHALLGYCIWLAMLNMRA